MRADNISTHLVAFTIISDIGQITNTPRNFSIWALPKAIENGHYILDKGPKLYQQMHDFAGINTGLEIVEMVAIPDFIGGTMESWSSK